MQRVIFQNYMTVILLCFLQWRVLRYRILCLTDLRFVSWKFVVVEQGCLVVNIIYMCRVIYNITKVLKYIFDWFWDDYIIWVLLCGIYEIIQVIYIYYVPSKLVVYLPSKIRSIYYIWKDIYVNIPRLFKFNIYANVGNILYESKKASRAHQAFW